jgi:hypothetical protein
VGAAELDEDSSSSSLPHDTTAVSATAASVILIARLGAARRCTGGFFGW